MQMKFFSHFATILSVIGLIYSTLSLELSPNYPMQQRPSN